MRLIQKTVAALAVLLVLPAAAEAHTVTPSIDCSAATLVYESTPGTTLSYEILVNGRMGRPGMIRRLTPLGGRLV